jgi:hypothetical protein
MEDIVRGQDTEPGIGVKSNTPDLNMFINSPKLQKRGILSYNSFAGRL